MRHNGGDGGDAEASLDQSVSQDGDGNTADVSNEGSATAVGGDGGDGGGDEE